MLRGRILGGTYHGDGQIPSISIFLLTVSDGRLRGIFRFEYLRQLAMQGSGNKRVIRPPTFLLEATVVMGDNSPFLVNMSANLTLPVRMSAELTLRFGFTFTDLYQGRSLVRLDAAFLEYVNEADAALCGRVSAARKDPASLAAKAESELLLALTPHLDAFIGELFAIEAELAVFFIDLDNFKQINDTLGHPFGDSVLREAVRRFHGLVRDGDTLARFGGDEFVLLVENLKQLADIHPIAQKMLAVLEPRATLQGNEVNLSASIGVCVFPDDGTEAAALLANADIAMYQAKLLGRKQVCSSRPVLL